MTRAVADICADGKCNWFCLAEGTKEGNKKKMSDFTSDKLLSNWRKSSTASNTSGETVAKSFYFNLFRTLLPSCDPRLCVRCKNNPG